MLFQTRKIIFGTQIKMFLINLDSSLTFPYRQQWNEHDQGPET